MKQGYNQSFLDYNQNSYNCNMTIKDKKELAEQLGVTVKELNRIFDDLNDTDVLSNNVLVFVSNEKNN